HRRHRRRSTAHSTAATADAVARAGARAVTDRAVATGADRAPAGTAAAWTETRSPEAEAAVHLAGLTAEQPAVHVVEAARHIAGAGQGCDRAAACLERALAEDARRARLFDRLLARELLIVGLLLVGLPRRVIGSGLGLGRWWLVLRLRDPYAVGLLPGE